MDNNCFHNIAQKGDKKEDNNGNDNDTDCNDEDARDDDANDDNGIRGDRLGE